MTPNPKPTGGSTIQAQILEQLMELKGKVEESLQQGRENGNDLKMLRRELGLDGQHGRLPIVEATLLRHEARMEKSEARVEWLETGNNEANGKAKLVATALALLGGGAGGALIAVLAHLLGAR
jgi:hypothetical protein